jgi:DNA-binding transcriptional regulator GbsR (MarR family)
MTTATPPTRDADLLAADAIGDVIEHWGFRKPLGRVWTVLYLEGEALSASALSERLQMSTGAMSMALTELQHWGVVQRVWRPGERKEFYEAETDFWKMISRVIRERERCLASGVREKLERATELVKRAPAGPETRARLARLKRLAAFATVAQTVLEGFVASQRADFSEFGNLLRLRTTTTKGSRS